MSPPVCPRLRRRYTLEDVRRAIDYIKHQGAGISEASRKYNIPKSTLHDKLTCKHKEDAPLGRPLALTKEEEDIIVQWVLNIAEAGFRITKDQLIDSVSCLVKKLNRPNPFKDNVPGESWYNLFLGRHPIISQHVSQASSRTQVTKEQLQEWFLKMKTYLLGKGLLSIFNDPRRVFTADECAFYLSPKGNKGLIRKYSKMVNHKTKYDEEEFIAVLLNANADGELAPPMVVFDDERIPDEIIRRFPDEWGIGKSTTGWMTREIFYEYVTYVFHPWLKSANIKFPVLLFIDGHYLSKYLSDFCFANRIEIVALYPNSTYLLHPLEVAVFKLLKKEWKRTVDQWQFANDGRHMTKEEFSPILQSVLQTLDSKVIVDSFKATGFSKLNSNGVHYSLTMKKQIHSPGISWMENKLSELRWHLCFLETKIGLEKVQRFAVNVVPTRDESLYEIWKSIKEEVITLGEQIAHKKQHPIPPVESINVPQTTNTTLETPDNIDDPDEDLTNQWPTEGGEDDKERSNEEEEEGRVLSVGNDPLNESVLRTLINDPSFSDCNGGMSIEIIVPSDENDYRLPGEATSSLSTNTQMATSQQSTHPPASLTSGTTIRSLTPQQSPEPISTNAVTNTQSLSPQQLPISSSFKRCLPYSSRTSIKKKVKSKGQSLVTGESYKLYLKKKEEKKKKEDKLEEQRKLIKETKKNLGKKPVIRKLIIIEDDLANSSTEDEDDDEPSPVEPEDLSVNSWVVVLYVVRGKKKPFVGQIKAIKKKSASVRFLVRKREKFVWPQEDDIDDEVPFSEIVQILSAPLSESSGYFSFKETIISSQL